MGERIAAHGGGGDEVRRRRSQTAETAGSETRTSSLCLGPVVCVSDRRSVRLSSRSIYPVIGEDDDEFLFPSTAGGGGQRWSETRTGGLRFCPTNFRFAAAQQINRGGVYVQFVSGWFESNPVDSVNTRVNSGQQQSKHGQLMGQLGPGQQWSTRSVRVMLRVRDSVRLGLGSVDSVSESTQSRLVSGQQVQLGSTRFLTARLSSTQST
ncbi:uncharacterized protein LOC110938915 [Helianthus annuus]|uniref:uncharacterized protein LOC110938915 n=1 Tax=Helianthus annuus TaxID=4232 RepID=UPI000B8EF90C|nr:uncharacterized protein LOC110938915 [Helianthus annuus]